MCFSVSLEAINLREAVRDSVMNQLQNDEIDFLGLFQTIWDGKWVITVITAVSLFTSLIVNFFSPPQNFIATTEIKTLLPSQAETYRMFNNTNVFHIHTDQALINTCRDTDHDSDRNGNRNKGSNREILLKLTPSVGLHERYLDILVRRQAFREGFKKFTFLDRDQYESDAAYEVAIARLAATIEFLPPTRSANNDRGKNRGTWAIKFQHHDQDKWLSALNYVSASVSRSVQASIKEQFKNVLNAEKSKLKHEIEDLQLARKNLIENYKQNTVSRVAFLKEQAAIARELAIAEYSTSDQKIVFSARNNVNGDAFEAKEVMSDEPFYMRGYKAIEKELSVLNSRKEVEPFVDGLLSVDRKITELQNSRKLERAEQLFGLTPVAREKDFIAASISTESTLFEYNSMQSVKLIMSIVFGLVFGVAFVMISKAMRVRKAQMKSS